MCMDGLCHNLDLANDLALLRRWPIEIAQHLLQTYGRDHDDALVLVAR
jgi:hypothetical protein